MNIGFDNSVVPKAGVLRAASAAGAARWDSRGMPGSPGYDTVFLVGDVYTQSRSAFAALPRLRAGTKITIQTDHGSLTYTVRRKGTRPSSGLLRTPDFTSKVPGRVVLIGVLFNGTDNRPTGKYVVVVAQLTGARKG